MTLRVQDVMQTEVRTVGTTMPLDELDRCLIDEGVSGFPVVDDGQLVGVVSRTDVVRLIDVERAYDAQISDYQRTVEGAEPTEVSPALVGARIGARIATLTVADAMIKSVITTSPDADLVDVAKQLLEYGIHRLPVTEDGKLLGIVTSLDLVRQIAEGRYQST